MSFSWWPTKPAPDGWGVVPVGNDADSVDLPDVFIGSTAMIEIGEQYGASIRDGLAPTELRVLASCIRQRVGATHSCNCSHCGYVAVDLGRTCKADWLKMADLFDAVAEQNWGIEGGY